MAKAKAPPPATTRPPAPPIMADPPAPPDPMGPEEVRAQAIRSIDCPYCKPIAFAADDQPAMGVFRWHHPRCGRPVGFDRP